MYSPGDFESPGELFNLAREDLLFLIRHPDSIAGQPALFNHVNGIFHSKGFIQQQARL